MRLGMPLSYSDSGFQQTVEDLLDLERAGVDQVFLAEAYTFDSVSQLGYIAAKTRTIGLGSGILNIYSRTPTLLAMTAAGLDEVSGGRFTLGIGASGPQVVEGFHGIPYDAPLGRSREVVEICRAVWRRERVDHHGEHYDIPLTRERGGSGLGKPLKLINAPVRDRIPVTLAALGPRNVELAAELFDGWEPIFFYPERAKEAFGEALARGQARRPDDLLPLEVYADVMACVSDDGQALDAALVKVRQHLALYIGGMGARGKNFYNELAGRYGFADAAAEVQELYLSGAKQQAAAALPEDLVRGTCLVGTQSDVTRRVAAYGAAGVTVINATPVSASHQERLKTMAQLREVV